MKKIKINKEFWDAIVSKKKQFEFRKLSKGITYGEYEFVEPSRFFKDGKPISYKSLGTAHLKPLALNPKFIGEQTMGDPNKMNINGFEFDIDIPSSDYVMENYGGRVDFVVYKIDDVVEFNNGR